LLLKIQSKETAQNPLTPIMVKQITDMLAFPIHVYVAKMLWDADIRKAHLHPYLRGNPHLNGVYNALQNMEQSNSVSPQGGLLMENSRSIEKLPQLNLNIIDKKNKNKNELAN
jgi:hypothetical protein